MQEIRARVNFFMNIYPYFSLKRLQYGLENYIAKHYSSEPRHSQGFL